MGQIWTQSYLNVYSARLYWWFSPLFPFSHFSSSHSDHRSVDNNSIYDNNKPRSCQGHPLASDGERGCAGSRNPDKLSWASLASPLHSHKSYLTAKGNLTTNWEAVINSSATKDSHPNTNDSLFCRYMSEALDQAGKKSSSLCGVLNVYSSPWCWQPWPLVSGTYLPEFKSLKQSNKNKRS